MKCGASALDVADRQNAHSQTVSLRGLYELFRIVGREKELYNKINGFSVSHSDVDVRIWGHLVVIKGENPEFYREPIAEFNISKTAQADNRWIAWTVVMNILEIWLPDHFERICSVIDMLPGGLNFEVSVRAEFQSSDPELASSRSVLSQQLQIYGLGDERDIPRSITPETTIQTSSSHPKKNKTKLTTCILPFTLGLAVCLASLATGVRSHATLQQLRIQRSCTSSEGHPVFGTACRCAGCGVC